LAFTLWLAAASRVADMVDDVTKKSARKQATGKLNRVLKKSHNHFRATDKHR
jgi:hypothetical protein